MMLHGLGDCTPERNCGCMAKPLDVLRERIARALWESDGQLPEWDAVPPGGQFRRAYYLSQADAVVAALGLVEDAGDVSDGYHTFRELYEYRMLYNAAWLNLSVQHNEFPVVKSWRHSDGELCFGGGWFVVVATLPTGQVSNHYKAEHWDKFLVPEGEPPEYDGHTPAEAADRLRRYVTPWERIEEDGHGA